MRIFLVAIQRRENVYNIWGKNQNWRKFYKMEWWGYLFFFCFFFFFFSNVKTNRILFILRRDPAEWNEPDLKEEKKNVRRLFVFLFTFDGRLLSLVLWFNGALLSLSSE